MFDEQAHFEAVNPKMLEMKGFPKGQLSGSSLSDILRKEETENAIGFLSKVIKTGSLAYDIATKKMNGNLTW